MIEKINRLQFLKPAVLSAILLFLSFGSIQANPDKMPETSPNTPPASMQQNKITVRGIVEDQAGPIIGANIKEKGTDNGTITDINGEFSLMVAPDSRLVVSYIGYIEAEIPVAGKKVLSILLKEDAQALDEVIVVGYGVQKKVNMTGSVATIGGENLEARPLTNVSNGLAGLAAGVSVRQTGGRPGTSSQIRIRGNGTFNDNEAGALVIIDGIPGSMDAVNPSDVESISILKDAASASIYGARAANGVILITTKKGTSSAPKISFSATYSRITPNNYPEFISDYAEYMELYNLSRTNMGLDIQFSPATIDKWREAAKDPNGLTEHGYPNRVVYPNTDWGDAIFENNWSQSYDLSISGGSETSKYNISAGYLNNPGIIENTGIERFQTRINVESTFGKFITLGTQTFMSHQRDQMANTDSSIFNYLRQKTPGVYPYKYNGYWAGPSTTEESNSMNSLLEQMNTNGGKDRRDRVNTTLFARIKIIEGLTFETKFNYQTYIYERNTYPLRGVRKNFALDTNLTTEQAASEMVTSYRKDRNYTKTFDNVLNYIFSIGQDHNFGVLLGHNEYYYNYTRNDFSKKGLITEGIYNPGAATSAQDVVSGEEYDRSMRSYFGRLNYDYQGKYLFEFNMRRDGSSRFGNNNRWGTFPSVSMAWRVSEEKFMEGTRDWLDNLKVRASVGKLGNDAAGNYDYQALYSPYKYSFNGNPIIAMAQKKMGNSNLKWEETRSTDLAIEMNMFNNRASAEINYYNKFTKGILTTPNILLVSGVDKGPTMNTADMRNKGIELTLGWKDRIGSVNYSLSGNFSYNKNKVEKYLGKYEEKTDPETLIKSNNIGKVSTNDGNGYVVEDKMYKEFYVRKVYKGNGSYYHNDGSVNINGGPKDGMIRTEADMDWLKAMQTAGYRFQPSNNIDKGNLYYGDLIYADLNGDKIYGSGDDREFTGKSALPKYNYGFNVYLDWNNFDFSMLWAGSAGHYFYKYDTGYNSGSTLEGNAISKDIAKKSYYYNEQDPNDPRTNISGKYPRMVYNQSAINGAASNKWLYNASYLKLKNLQVGYTLPKQFTQRMRIEKMRIYFTGENLLTITPFPFLDPEMGAGMGYPIMKEVAFGLSVNF